MEKDERQVRIMQMAATLLAGGLANSGAGNALVASSKVLDDPYKSLSEIYDKVNAILSSK